MPGKPLALIGGTSLLNATPFRQAEPMGVVTPYGEVTLLQTGGLIFVQRHGLNAYHPPHRINHQANLWAIRQAGGQRILAVGSVGSLHGHIPPGAMVVPDDFYAPWANPSFFDDARGHQAPGFDAPWRQQVLNAWSRLPVPQPVVGGVYWQTRGPRFETPAEIRFHQAHCHVVGMTVASECILARELELPYAAVCMVDNYANGVSQENLSYDSFREQVAANQTRLLAILEPLLQALMEDTP